MTNETAQPPPSQDLVDFADPAWFRDMARSTLLVRAYRVFRQASSPTVVLKLPRARLILVSGTLKYADHTQMHLLMHDETHWELVGAPKLDARTPQGTFLLILVPYVVDGAPANEQEVRAQTQEISGVVLAIAGRNAAFSLEFENEIAMSKTEVSVVSPAWLNPMSIEPPRLDADRLNFVKRIVELAHGGSPDSANLRLSLRWFEASARETDGIDAFVKCWIAIEALVMRDYGDLDSVIDSLARGYKLSGSEARQRFQIGRIFRFRGLVLHRGLIVPVPYWINEYLEGIYADVLLDLIGEAIERKADEVMARHPGEMEAFLAKHSR